MRNAIFGWENLAEGGSLKDKQGMVGPERWADPVAFVGCVNKAVAGAKLWIRAGQRRKD